MEKIAGNGTPKRGEKKAYKKGNFLSQGDNVKPGFFREHDQNIYRMGKPQSQRERHVGKNCK